MQHALKSKCSTSDLDLDIQNSTISWRRGEELTHESRCKHAAELIHQRRACKQLRERCMIVSSAFSRPNHKTINMLHRKHPWADPADIETGTLLYYDTVKKSRAESQQL